MDQGKNENKNQEIKTGNTIPDGGWYNDFYTAVGKSKAYSNYCEKVFGMDLSQQGFSDLQQVNFMLDILKIRNMDRILDVGCGNGKLIEYISDSTDATGYGFDISSVAISSACQRTADKSKKLIFEEGIIGEKQYKAESFDAIISIDTMYFSDSMAKTIADFYRWLKPFGKIAIMYSEFRFNENEPLDKMSQEGNALAKALKKINLKYDVYDLTSNHYEHMKLKNKVITEMEGEFKKEGNLMLYENAKTESIENSVIIEDFKKNSVRYLYIVKKR